MKYICIVCIIISFYSCKKTELKNSQELITNGSFQLEFLFEQNGCKMYRFEDNGRFIYWTDCQGKIQSDYERNNGKHRKYYKEETITTE